MKRQARRALKAQAKLLKIERTLWDGGHRKLSGRALHLALEVNAFKRELENYK